MKKNSLWVKNSTFHSVVPFRTLLSVCVCVIYEYFKEIFMSVDMNI